MNKDILLEEVRKAELALNLVERYGDIDSSLTDDVWHLIDCINKLDEPEKIVIPQFIADWYEENLSGDHTNNRNKFSGNDVFRIIQDVLETSEGFKVFENYGIYKEIATWAEKNEEAFIHLIANCSYKDGYEVEKEKLYIIKFAPSIYGTPTYGSIGTQNGKKIMQTVYGSQEGIIPNQYTKKEIEEVDSKYMIFAEEVTE